MADESKELVPHVAIGREILKMGGDERGLTFLSTLDPTDKDYKRQVFAMMQKNGEKINGYINKEIKIVSFVAFPCEFQDEESGELVNTVMVRMLLDNGKMIQTHSNTVRKKLALACELQGKPTKKSPFVCTPVSQPLRDGKKSLIDLEFPT